MSRKVAKAQRSHEEEKQPSIDEGGEVRRFRPFSWIELLLASSRLCAFA
jgi:hypothetical protein